MAIAFHGSAALFSEFDPSHLLESDGKFKFGVVLLAWPTAQTKPEAGDNYALMDYSAFHIIQVDRVQLDDKAKLIEGSQETVATY